MGDGPRHEAAQVSVRHHPIELTLLFVSNLCHLSTLVVTCQPQGCCAACWRQSVLALGCGPAALGRDSPSVDSIALAARNSLPSAPAPKRRPLGHASSQGAMHWEVADASLNASPDPVKSSVSPRPSHLSILHGFVHIPSIVQYELGDIIYGQEYIFTRAAHSPKL